MGGVNQGAENIYGGPAMPPGRPTYRLQREQVDGRGKQLTIPEMPPEIRQYMDGGAGAWTYAISNVNTTVQLPVPGAEYRIVVMGNTACCLYGGAGAVATTAAGGFDFPVADAVWTPKHRPTDTHLAFIGVAGAPAGTISILLMREP